MREKGVHTVLVRSPEGMRSIRIPRCRWEDLRE
jgi:hypothetical protein